MRGLACTHLLHYCVCACSAIRSLGVLICCGWKATTRTMTTTCRDRQNLSLFCSSSFLLAPFYFMHVLCYLESSRPQHCCCFSHVFVSLPSKCLPLTPAAAKRLRRCRLPFCLLIRIFCLCQSQSYNFCSSLLRVCVHPCTYNPGISRVSSSLIYI